MSIINRLKKLQNRIIGNDSNFCGCEKEPQIIILIPTADGSKQTIDGKPYIEPPEFCQACGKPNAEPLHATFTINPNVELTGEA
jgi:hypothetical protein